MSKLSTSMLVAFGAANAYMIAPPMTAPNVKQSRCGIICAKDLEGDEAALYAFGTNIGRQLGDMKVFSRKELDTIFLGAIDQLVQAEPKCDVKAYLPNGIALLQAKEERARERTAEAGQEALAAAAAEPGAVQTDSGLVILIEKEGEGAKATAEDTVRCHYEGRLVDGTVFDSSYQRGEPLEFPVTGVIKGWIEALQTMNAGSKAKLTIPSDLAYGDAGTGPIPGGATLIFDIELLAVNP